MKEKIEQLSKGYMTYELPHIVLGEEKISLNAAMGKKRSASVSIGNEAGISMKGLVYSTNPRVTVSNPQFVGSENVIEFVCNAEYAEVGEKIEGQLNFVTSCGEITLPYRFKVVAPVLNSIEGPVRNTVQFAALARNNNNEAKRLFVMPEFESFLAYYEPQNVLLRERLLKSPSASIALEEFLVGTRKKMAVGIDFSEPEKKYTVGMSNFSDSVKVIKSSWGYIELNVYVSADFIEPEQQIINNDDFIGTEYELKYVVYPERMRPGLNRCEITLSGCGVTKKIAITCNLPHEDKADREKALLIDQLIIKAMDNYLAYSMNQIPAGRYVSEARSLLDRYDMLTERETLLSKLYRVRLYRLSGKESPATALFNNITDEEVAGSSVLERGLYLYMLHLGREDDNEKYLEELYTLININPEEQLLKLVAYRCEERFARNPKYGLDELRSYFDQGMRSPLLFRLVADIFNNEPLLLKELGDFELGVLLFALKRDYCSKDLAAQATALILRTRTYSKTYVNLLTMIYDRYQPKDALTAICQVLIRGFRKESRYFKWYQRGVEENIRIADLYEYYMYSLDREIEEDLDQSVLMYYVYNSKLNDRKLAYLYANIVMHKDSNPIVYENYKEKLRLFAAQQMREGRAGKAMSILYNDCMSDEKASAGFPEFLYRVIFKHEIVCDNPLMKYVCVVHKETDEEIIVPLIGGSAQVDICTDDALVLMMDAANNRYYPGEDVTVTRLMEDDSLVIEAYQRGREKDRLILHLAERAHKQHRFDQLGIDLRKQATALSNINEKTRELYLAELALYFYDHSMDEIPEDDLDRLDYGVMNSKARGKLIGLMILREQYQKAYYLMNEYGFSEVEPKLLEKYVSSLSPSEAGKYDKTVLDICWMLFANGRRSEKMLVYLVNFYNGLTGRLYDIWQEAVEAKCATSDFDERLLVQILFTESYLPYGEQIYIHYHRRSKNRMLTKAYFNYLSYKYLISDVPLTAVTVDNMKKDAYYETNDIVILALLKRYANAGELSKEEQDFSKHWLEVMVSKGKILPCFTRFGEYFRLPEDMDDKLYIEYRSNPEHRIMIMIASRQDGKRVVREESMRNVCYGIFIKEIVLFAQETIEYVITDDDGENVTGTEKQTVTGRDDPTNRSKSRFSRINAIISARNAKDKGAAVALLNDYVKNEFAISQLFHEIV